MNTARAANTGSRSNNTQGYCNSNQTQFCSGIGQFHTNESDLSKPTKKLTEYLTIDRAAISRMVDKPQQVSKDKAQWLISSTYMSRNADQQKQHGLYYALTVDLDKHPPPVNEVAEIIDMQLGHVNYEIYNTASATEENQKCRVLIWIDTALGFVDWNICQQILNDRLEQLCLMPDRALEKAAQLVYLPNRGAFYKTAYRRNGKYFDPIAAWDYEISEKKDEAQAAQNALTNAKLSVKPKKAVSSLNDAPDLIQAFNAKYTPIDIVLMAGYDVKADAARHPDSESGNYSATVKADANGVLRINALSPADPLFVDGGGAHDAFSAYTVLFHNGDHNAALRAAGDEMLTVGLLSFNKAKQNEHMQAKADKELMNSFDVCAGIAPELKDKGLNLFPEPFKGVMADTVASIMLSAHKPQLELSTLSVLIGMASAIGGDYSLSDGTRLNLYGLGIAETGEGKDLVGRSADIIARNAGAALLGKPASGQGLEDALVDTSGMLIRVDEVGHMLQSMNHAKAAPYQIELNENLLKLYSAGAGQWTTRVKANAKGNRPPRTLTNPCLNFLGFTTPAALSAGLSLMNIEQGLLGRFLLVRGKDGVQQRRSTIPLKLDIDMFENFRELALQGIF